MNNEAHIITAEQRYALEELFTKIDLHLSDLKRAVPNDRTGAINAYRQYASQGLGILKKLDTQATYSEMLDSYIINSAPAVEPVS